MSPGSHTRTRLERVAQLDLPPNRFERAIAMLKRKEVLIRLGMCILAAAVMLLSTGAWQPPFVFRKHAYLDRVIIARVTFAEPDLQKTNQEREKARRTVQCVYDHDIQPLLELREALKNRVFQLIRAESFTDVHQGVWSEFIAPPEQDEQPISPDDRRLQIEQQYQRFVEALADDEELDSFDKSVSRAFDPFEQFGLFEGLEHKLEQGSQTDIVVHRVREAKFVPRVPAEQVRLAEASANFQRRLAEELANEAVAGPVFHWLESRLPVTLIWNKDLTREAADKAAANIDEVMVTYAAGEDQMAVGGRVLTPSDIQLLRREHDAWLQQRTVGQGVNLLAAKFGMYTALYILCGAFTYYRHRTQLSNVRKFATLQILIVITMIAAWWVWDDWQSELVPLTIFGMIVAIAYSQELALMLAAAVSLTAIVTLGFGLSDFVIVTACLAAAILLLRDVSSRTKLIYVGLVVGIVAFLTTFGVNVALNTPIDTTLLSIAGKNMFYCFLAGLLMTAMLPFVEYVFDIQTDLSLLELGDVSHTLLQELVRRAPGTYNHSINVASIAEAAADAIGANGLLVRVGAYFHDIGKMLKPMYFVENQGSEGNRHESLVPAMSTLIIIAHVKDGADLARQHHLPQSMIDFILQHHGTTIVEYFYNRASEQSEEDPDTTEVDEGSYRYPGPKPQTREAAVLMLSDAVESASRSLQEPGAARIESLVRSLAMKRLEDGQFDECHLTLSELHTIQESLVKSLTSMYHGRVKYPNQQSA